MKGITAMAMTLAVFLLLGPSLALPTSQEEKTREAAKEKMRDAKTGEAQEKKKHDDDAKSGDVGTIDQEKMRHDDDAKSGDVGAIDQAVRGKEALPKRGPMFFTTPAVKEAIADVEGDECKDVEGDGFLNVAAGYPEAEGLGSCEEVKAAGGCEQPVAKKYCCETCTFVAAADEEELLELGTETPKTCWDALDAVAWNCANACAIYAYACMYDCWDDAYDDYSQANQFCQNSPKGNICDPYKRTCSCTADTHCKGSTKGDVCISATNVCGECTADSHCTGSTKGDVCNSATNVCQCFPSNATVILASGSSVTMDSLKHGDVIQATDADGNVVYDEVSFYSYASHKESEFVKLRTNTDRSLQLTAGHHLPVGATCCENLAVAGAVKVGTKVWALDKGRDTAAQEVVVSVEKVNAIGLHSPVLVNGGFPVVDGFVTSFDALPNVRRAAKWFPAVSAVCKYTGTCAYARTAVQLFDDPGLPGDNVFAT